MHTQPTHDHGQIVADYLLKKSSIGPGPVLDHNTFKEMSKIAEGIRIQSKYANKQLSPMELIDLQVEAVGECYDHPVTVKDILKRKKKDARQAVHVMNRISTQKIYIAADSFITKVFPEKFDELRFKHQDIHERMSVYLGDIEDWNQQMQSIDRSVAELQQKQKRLNLRIQEAQRELMKEMETRDKVESEIKSHFPVN
jgi:chromosome segregation ATPase